MTERLIAFKITSDGKAFAVDMTANAKATQDLGRQFDETATKAEAVATKVKKAAKDIGAATAGDAAAGVNKLAQAAKEAGAPVAQMGTAAQAAGQQLRQMASKESASGVDAVGAAAKRAVQDVNALASSIGKMPPIPALAPARGTSGIDETRAKLKGVGDQAQATAQQMRQVAPQITDVVTQLAGGANPLQILIQQGGQLKDVFGGVGPAARAVSGYLGAMITPATLAAGAVGALAIAAYQGAEEVARLERGVILSGNAAGITVSRYREMADELARIGGTKGAALETLTALAQQGRVAAENLQRFGAVAQQMNRLVGKPVQETVQEFAALAKSPVEASQQLAQTYNYLTAATYAQIKALQDAGRTTEAAKLAQETFANSLAERMPEMEKHLGTLERLWLRIKSAVAGAADAALDVGRPLSSQGQVDQANRIVRQLEAQIQQRQSKGLATGDLDRQLAAAKALVPLAEAEVSAQAKGAFLASERAKQREAAARWGQVETENLEVREARERKIDQIRRDGVVLGKSEKQIAEEVSEVRRRMVDPREADGLQARIARLQKFNELQAEFTRQGVEKVSAALKQGLISDFEQIDQAAALEVAQLKQHLSTLQGELRVVRTKPNSSALESAALEGEIAIQQERIRGREKKHLDDIETLRSQKRAKERAAIAEFHQQNEEDQAKEEKASRDRSTASRNAVDEYVYALELENKEVEFQVSLMGKSAVEQVRLIELRRIEIALLKEKQEIAKRAAGGNLTAAEVDEEIRRVEDAAARAAANLSTREYVAKWSDANRQAAESLYLFITRRGGDAKRQLASAFEQLVLRPQIMAALSPVSGGIANYVSGSSAAIGGGNLLGTLGNASSLWNTGKGAVGEIVNGTLLGNIGAGFAGTGGSFASTVGAGLATDAMGATVIEGAAAATLGTGGGIGAAMAAIPGWGWAALAAAAVASMIANGGETRVGGQYSNGQLLGAPSGGQIDGASQAVAATINSINELLGAAGSSSRVRQLLTGLEQSEHEKGFAYAGGFLTGGEAFGQYQDGYLNRRGSKSKEQALAEFSEELKQATLQALQKADIPGYVGEYLRELGDVDALSGGALDQALAKVSTYLAQRKELEERLYQATATEVEKAARTRQRELDAVEENNRALLQRIHALEDETKRTERLTSMADRARGLSREFADDKDLNAVIAAQIAERLKAAGVPATSEMIMAGDKSGFLSALKALQESGNLDGMEAMLDVASDFLMLLERMGEPARKAAEELERLKEELKEIGAGLSGYLRELRADRAGTAAPWLRQSLTSANAEADYALAMGGDVDAHRRLQGSVAAAIEAQKGMTASGPETQAVIDAWIGKLSGLPAVQSYEQQNIALLGEIKVGIEKLPGAMGKYLAENFDRFDANLDGLLTNDEYMAGAVGKATDAELQRIWTLLDLNGDGTISKLELLGGKSDATNDKLTTMVERFSANSLLAYDAKTIAEAYTAIIRNTGITADYVAGWGAAIVSAVNGRPGAAPAGAPAPSSPTTGPAPAPATGGPPGVSQADVDAYQAALASGQGIYEFAASRGYTSEQTSAWLTATGFPAFANGGLHTGGLRMVGERGRELEVTGPARYYSAEQTSELLNGDDTAIREELRRMSRMLEAAMQQVATITAQAASRTLDVQERVATGVERLGQQRERAQPRNVVRV
ncbi:phage tail length tape measure family protein [Ramlibacter sp.]|uniref:phage tail length tape measure family protein n=1 Tax=Ramlibacter sp. TaxID=1917967 RepID=UPI003D0E1CF4